MEKIFLDLDGVVADFNRAAALVFNIDVHNPSVREQLKQDANALYNLAGGKNNFWKYIYKQGESFWSEMELFPWGKDLYNDLQKMCPNLFILTSPPHDPRGSSGKVKFIQRHFNTRRFLIGPPKYACAGPTNLLIDDTIKKISEFKEYGGRVYHFPNSYKIEDGEITYESIIEEVGTIYENIKHGRISQES